jgi:hypothetical protein
VLLSSHILSRFSNNILQFIKCLSLFYEIPKLIGAGIAQSVWRLATDWKTEGYEFDSW